MLLVYSKDNCSRCQTVKSQLKQKGIPFSEKILDKDYTRDELLKIVPPNVKMFPFVFDSNGFVFLDYDSKLKEYINNF